MGWNANGVKEGGDGHEWDCAVSDIATAAHLDMGVVGLEGQSLAIGLDMSLHAPLSPPMAWEAALLMPVSTGTQVKFFG